MGYMTARDLTDLVLDVAAALILFGMIHYTSHYRKRGRIDDKIYFGMLVITILCALANAAASAVDGIFGTGADALKVALNDIFFIAMDLSFCVMTVYFDQRSRKENALSKKRICVLSLPAVFTAIALAVNHRTHFIFWVDRTTGRYTELAHFYIIYLAPVLYAIAILVVCRWNKGALSVLILLILARSVLEGVMRDVSSTALFLAIVLVFIHINEMRYAFYDEERNAVEEKERG